MQDLNIKLLQTDLHWQDPAQNRQDFARLFAKHAAGTDLIVLPEMFTTGFTMNAADNCEPGAGATVQWLQAQAAEYDVALCGSLIISEQGHFYNRLIWAQPERAPQHYDKRHLFRMAGEHQHFAAGETRLIVELGDWRICPLICYDLRFPAWSRGNNEFDLLLYVANWPAARQSAWDTLLPARSVENLCYVAGVNRVGTDGNDVAYAGGSIIADYLGNQLQQGGDNAEVLSATLSLAKLNRYRDKFPAWKDADKITIDNAS